MTLDYLIIGAGPAGLQLGALLEADGDSDYLILEAADTPGAFFRTFPRHRQLISINKPHTGTTDPELNLRLDWNSIMSEDGPLFTSYTNRYFPDADLMVRYLSDFAGKTGAKIVYNARVTRVTKDGDDFAVTTEKAEYRAKRVVMATGVSKMFIPDIPGIEHAERYDTMPTDPADFEDQRVLILGKGNSGFETADNLIETTTLIHVAGPHDVKLAWRTHFVGHLRAVNNNFLDTYQLKSANAILDGTVREIRRDGNELVVTFAFARADEVTKQLRYDRILACTGFAFDASIFDESCRPELAINDRFPKQTPAWESVNVPGLYFAGTITQQRDFKKSTSGFIHGFRYAVRALHKILQQRYAGKPWPATRTADATQAIIARVNRSSALWQQFGFLADVILPDGQYLEEMPVDLFHEQHGDGLVITLEYGPDHDQVDPFDISVNRINQNNPGQAHDAAYLHPVVRAYRDGVLAGTHHLAENLENRWDRPDAHVAPLAAFLAQHRP